MTVAAQHNDIDATGEDDFVVDTGCVANRYARVRVLRTVAELPVFLDWLENRASMPLGLDSETNAIDPWEAGYRLRLVQVADEFESWVIVAEDLPKGVVSYIIKSHRFWVAHFSESEVRYIGRGAPGCWHFDSDEPHVADYQVVLGWSNPRTLMPQGGKDGIDPRLPQPKGLKETSARELSPMLAEIEKVMHARFKEIAPVGHRTPTKSRVYGFAHISSRDPIYLRYSALDPLMTIRLWNRDVAKLRENGVWAGVKDDLDWQWHIDRLTFAGIGVDGQYADWLANELEGVVQYNARYLHGYGIKPTGMGPQVGEAFSKLGVKSPKRTKPTERNEHGNESWDKEVISKLASLDSPLDNGEQVRGLATAVKAVRQATKFASAYVSPMLDALQRDGRVHWSHRALGTITSRHSAARPALQQQPKKDTRVRAAYQADPGYVLVSCDLSQGEPRTMAALSGDGNLLEDIYSGDLNGAIAAAAYADYNPAEGKTAGTTSYGQRQQGKIAFLSMCYGAGLGKVDVAAGVAPGTYIGTAWKRRYHRLFQYEAELNSRASVTLDNGFIIPLWDRFTVLQSGELRLYPKSSRKALNYRTQGQQRLLLQQCWKRLVAAGWGWAAYFFLHDEIILHVPIWMAEEARQALSDAMTFVYRDVRFECEAEINGRTWLPQPTTFAVAELESVDMEGELIDA